MLPSKQPSRGASEALNHELAPFGIHLKLVEPGYGPDTKFQTSMVALNDANSFPAPYQPQLNARMSNLPKSQRPSRMLLRRYFGRRTTPARASDTRPEPIQWPARGYGLDWVKMISWYPNATYAVPRQ